MRVLSVHRDGGGQGGHEPIFTFHIHPFPRTHPPPPTHTHACAHTYVCFHTHLFLRTHTQDGDEEGGDVEEYRRQWRMISMRWHIYENEEKDYTHDLAALASKFVTAFLFFFARAIACL